MKRWMLLTIVILSLVLTACGGGGGDDATQPVKDFFDAFTALDAEKASQAVCEQYRDDTQAGLEMITGLLSMAGEDAAIEITDLKLEARDQTDDEATIVVTGGKMTMTMGGEVQEETDLTSDAEPLKVVKEGGKWVICDDAFLGELSP